MRHLAITSLLLVACSGDETASTSTTGGGGDMAAQVGSGGAGGDGGVTSAQSSTAEATIGAGGEGGDTASTTSAGGSGGGTTASTGVGGSGGEEPWQPPCEPSACEPFGLYCDDCGSAQTCDDEVCSDVGGPEPMLIDGALLGGVALRVPRIDPGTMHPSCESVCGAGAAWAVRLALPSAGGCWTVDAPPGWFAATRPAVGDEPPRACPVASANTDECVRGTYADGDHLVVWLREGEGSQAANIWITVTTEPCPEEPVDCGPATCNGEEQ